MNLAADRAGPLAARLVVGGVFVWASVYKIAAPIEFARMIHGYDLLPGVAVNALALLLPWMEFTAGAALIVGRGTVGATALIAAMLLVFEAAIGINLARGIDFSCGCTSADAGSLTSNPWFAFSRNIGLLALCAYLSRSWARPAAPPPAPGSPH